MTASFRRRTCNGDPYTEERSQIALLGSGVVNGKILSELRGCTRRNSESWEGLIADFLSCCAVWHDIDGVFFDSSRMEATGITTDTHEQGLIPPVACHGGYALSSLNNPCCCRCRSTCLDQRKMASKATEGGLRGTEDTSRSLRGAGKLVRDAHQAVRDTLPVVRGATRVVRDALQVVRGAG